MEELIKIYKENNFPVRAKFIKILKSAKVSYTKQELDKLYNEDIVAQQFTTEKKKSVNMKYITALQIWENLQVDIIVYERYKANNRGYEYILIAVDVFSRFMFCEPLKTKTAKETLDAFKRMTSEIKDDMRVITTDSGSEYKSIFNDYLEQNEIIHFVTSVGNHATLGIVDRACRTLRSEIEKHVVGNDTLNWVDSLQKIVKQYNNSEHRGILNLKPNAIEDNIENTQSLTEVNEAKNEENKHIKKQIVKPEFHVNDYVRKKLKDNAFKKGFSTQYSHWVYKVREVPNEFVVKLTNGDIFEQKKLLLVRGYTEEQFNNQRESKQTTNSRANKVKKAMRDLASS